MSVYAHYTFLPGKYRAYVRTTYRNGLMEEATVTSNKHVFTCDGIAIISVTQGSPTQWDGSETTIIWSGGEADG